MYFVGVRVYINGVKAPDSRDIGKTYNDDKIKITGKLYNNNAPVTGAKIKPITVLSTWTLNPTYTEKDGYFELNFRCPNWEAKEGMWLCKGNTITVEQERRTLTPREWKKARYLLRGIKARGSNVSDWTIENVKQLVIQPKETYEEGYFGGYKYTFLEHIGRKKLGEINAPEHINVTVTIGKTRKIADKSHGRLVRLDGGTTFMEIKTTYACGERPSQSDPSEPRDDKPTVPQKVTKLHTDEMIPTGVYMAFKDKECPFNSVSEVEQIFIEFLEKEPTNTHLLGWRKFAELSQEYCKNCCELIKKRITDVKAYSVKIYEDEMTIQDVLTELSPELPEPKPIQPEPTPPDSTKNVCCQEYVITSEGKKVSRTFMTEEKNCWTPPKQTGGGLEIVSEDKCTEQPAPPNEKNIVIYIVAGILVLGAIYFVMKR